MSKISPLLLPFACPSLLRGKETWRNLFLAVLYQCFPELRNCFFFSAGFNLIHFGTDKFFFLLLISLPVARAPCDCVVMHKQISSSGWFQLSASTIQLAATMSRHKVKRANTLWMENYFPCYASHVYPMSRIRGQRKKIPSYMKLREEKMRQKLN